MDTKLPELIVRINDLADELDAASDAAYDLSGAYDGQAYTLDGEPGDQPPPGWEDMLLLCERLSDLGQRVRLAIPDEVIEAAIEAAKEATP